MGTVYRVEMQDGIDCDDLDVADRLMNVKGVYSVTAVEGRPSDTSQGKLFGDVDTLSRDDPILPQPMRVLP